jgi:hypothetical protein
VPEELLMSMVGINRIKQIHAIAKFEERPSVLVTEVSGLFDSFPQGIDLCSGLRHADNISLIRGIMNVMFTSRPRLISGTHERRATATSESVSGTAGYGGLEE